MESLSLCLSPFSLIPKPHKTNPKFPSISPKLPPKNHLPKTLFPILITSLSSPPSFALEITEQSIQSSEKINIEEIVVSIDNFFNKYPFFVFGVTFVWLVVIPLVEEYLRKYKFISPINAFKKLRDDSSAQMLDIRDEKSLKFIKSPNLRLFKKDVVQVCFNEGDEDGFLKNVMEKFDDPLNTVVCIVDNFDGNSIKVAELLVKNGFKEAYAVKGGISGKSGWREIQQELLPPSVHVYPKKKAKSSEQRESNGAINQSDTEIQTATSEN